MKATCLIERRKQKREEEKGTELNELQEHSVEESCRPGKASKHVAHLLMSSDDQYQYTHHNQYHVIYTS